jgi:16S rRNA (cytosine967-C5)-methyltransferase
LQKRIINGVASTLKLGGVLVYATCTITREENEDLVEGFLNEQKNFVLEAAQRYLPEKARRMALGNYFVSRPHLHDTDGFFAARLRKVG